MPTLAIVGSRGFKRLGLVRRLVMGLPSGTTVVSGGAAGVDRAAAASATARGLQTIVILPDWGRFGRAGGPIRNAEIIDRADYVVAFWDGKSRGTADTLRQAEKVGRRTWLFLDKT